MEHDWIGCWLTDELEGAICSVCELEVLDDYFADGCHSECLGDTGVNKTEILSTYKGQQNENC